MWGVFQGHEKLEEFYIIKEISMHYSKSSLEPRFAIVESSRNIPTQKERELRTDGK